MCNDIEIIDGYSPAIQSNKGGKDIGTQNIVKTWYPNKLGTAKKDEI